MLWERGLWKAGMVETVDDDDPKGRDQVRLRLFLAARVELRACAHT